MVAARSTLFVETTDDPIGKHSVSQSVSQWCTSNDNTKQLFGVFRLPLRCHHPFFMSNGPINPKIAMHYFYGVDFPENRNEFFSDFQIIQLFS